MSYEIKVLDLMDVDVESSFLVLARNMGVVTRAKTWAYLISAATTRSLSTPARLARRSWGGSGMTGHTSEEQHSRTSSRARREAEGRALDPAHAHHIDHAGQDDNSRRRRW